MQIDTFFRTNSDFIPISKFTQLVPDEDYIEGAIEITIRGKKVLSRKHWDYVDQLWSYFLEGIEAINDGRSFSTSLPDQPVEVSFDLHNTQQVQVRVRDDEVVMMPVDRKLFLSTMVQACTEFFLHLPKAAPGLADLSKQSLKRIAEIAP